jgi:hypothetical protein
MTGRGGWRVRAAVVALAAMSMAHVGSADTFFTGQAGAYDVRVTVRLPGVIPGRAQVTVRLPAVTTAGTHHVTVQAAQWNVGLKGAPPPEAASPVPGDPTLFAAELWFMTATSYQLSVVVDGPDGRGSVSVPVMAIATAERGMPSWLGAVLAGLGVFLTVGMLTIIGTAMRESVLPPGVEPDASRRRRGRIGMAAAAVIAALMLWGGNTWWAAEAANYGRFILFRPFATTASVNAGTLTLNIRDDRWTGTPVANSRYNALLPDHGKLMHMFLVRDGEPDAFAHVHPVPRPGATAFDVPVPPLPAGRYRVYSDIVHESGYAQTLVSSVDLPSAEGREAGGDPDDSWFTAPAAPESASTFPLAGGAQLVWDRRSSLTAGSERELMFSVRDAGGAALTVEPYMGMAAHVAIANRDGSVFAHLHPSGSVSMAALQKFTAGSPGDAHAGHAMPLAGQVSIPFAFPRPGVYRVWVQVKRNGRVETAAFDTTVK